MNTETLLIITIPAILFALTRTTEKILDVQQQERDKGNDQKTYL